MAGTQAKINATETIEKVETIEGIQDFTTRNEDRNKNWIIFHTKSERRISQEWFKTTDYCQVLETTNKATHLYGQVCSGSMNYMDLEVSKQQHPHLKSKPSTK